ncbi:MAG TPA: Ig-like domain repeat protein, partial [Casimicrobiaceae bacterium]|nr:Ig-like domain repeat protein [Casimicrobiaceae bacterium]
MLALFIALPAQSHSTKDSPVRALAPAAVEVVAGTVEELVIEDRVNNTTRSYYGLQRDDGTTVLLTGPSAEALQDGARVEVRGQQSGFHFAVQEVQPLSPLSRSDAATRAANAAQVEGTLTIAHADDFDAGRSQFLYQVHDDAGRVTTLSVAVLPAVLRGGMRVIVSGQRGADASSLRPERITILSAPAGGAEAKSDLVAKAATTNSVLVILANFNNTVAPAYTAAQAQQVVSTNAYSVANYYSDVSYGQQLLNVTVTGSWVTMNLAASCNWSSIGSAAEAAALAANPAYNAANYNFVVYLFPAQSCGWSGLAYVGFPHKSWINGTGAFNTKVIAHEMGHNFGLLHAGSLNCGAVSIGGSCSVAEYGDTFDTMGNAHAMHFNARQKSLLNWIPATSVKTHTSGSVNYTLDPLELPGGSVYAVKIPTASSLRTYWLEFRQPLGFDSPSNPAANFSWPNNGAQIRVASPFEWTSGADDTEIVDMTPGTPGNFTDAALVVGQSYLDSTYGINVIVTGASASALTVSVTTGGGTATTTTLSSSSNPSTVGTNVTFTATVTGASPTGTVNFKDGATSIAACSAVALTGSGNSRTAVCTTNTLTAGAHSIVA